MLRAAVALRARLACASMPSRAMRMMGGGPPRDPRRPETAEEAASWRNALELDLAQEVSAGELRPALSKDSPALQRELARSLVHRARCVAQLLSCVCPLGASTRSDLARTRKPNTRSERRQQNPAFKGWVAKGEFSQLVAELPYGPLGKERESQLLSAASAPAGWALQDPGAGTISEAAESSAAADPPVNLFAALRAAEIPWQPRAAGRDVGDAMGSTGPGLS